MNFDNLPEEIVVTILRHEKMELLKCRSETTFPTINPNLRFNISLEIHVLGASFLKAMEIR
jgi:hypothetical protein